MNTFKDFFKKHLALNLLALILPCSLFVLGFFLIPQGYVDYSGFHPMNLFLAFAILSVYGLVFFTNGIFVAKTRAKKITAIIFVYISFITYLIAFYFIELLIFQKDWGFIPDISSQDHPSNPRWIDDALYTVLAPSFVTVFVIVGVIIFTVYLIKSAKKNKQQKTDTTTA